MKGDLLPKSLRVKGKSKYLHIRLKEENLKNINELWERYYPTKLWEKIKKYFRDLSQGIIKILLKK